MKNSGLVSVGHLLSSELNEERRSTFDERRLTFRHFCTVLGCNLGEKMVKKSAAHWMYDQVSYVFSYQFSVFSFQFSVFKGGNPIVH
jgi:hypothetical protein